MRILLVDPPLSRYAWNQTPAPPLGLLYLAAAIERLSDHHSLSILPLQFDKERPAEKLASVVSAFHPDLVGFSTPTPSTPQVLELAKTVRLCAPETLIVFGGYQATIDGARLVESDACDVVVCGEGESVFCELVQALESAKGTDGLHRVHGIVYQTSQGDIVRTSPTKRLYDLDRLPYPARHLINMQDYKGLSMSRAASIIASRGCSWNCGFCYSPPMWGPAVYRSNHSILDEIEQELIAKHGLSYARFEDDTFFVSRARTQSFVEQIQERRISFKWEARARVDFTDEVILVKAMEAGLQSVQVGVETIQSGSLSTLNKRSSYSACERFFDMAQRLGLGLRVSVIVGIPDETPRQMKETLAWLESRLTAKDQFIRCMFTPYSGISYTDPRWKVLSTDLAQYTMDIPLVTGDLFSLDELLEVKAYADSLMRQHGPYESIRNPMPSAR